MSESIEMYLVMTAMLRTNDAPVSLSRLAEHLSISSASANEMCRKLEERGLVHYQPYKGITLTEEGEAIAQQVLSRRRLWMAFLIESLRLDPNEADELACQLEHITSAKLVEALAAFLARATPSIESTDAERTNATVAEQAIQPLAAMPPGWRGQIHTVHADKGMRDLLAAQGLRPDAAIEVLVTSRNGVVVVHVGQQQLSLAPVVATCVQVVPLPTDSPPLLRCAQDMCQGFMICLKRQDRMLAYPNAPCRYLLGDNQEAPAGSGR